MAGVGRNGLRDGGLVNPRHQRRPQPHEPGDAPDHCPGCGHDLRGTPAGTKCPECGHAPEPGEAAFWSPAAGGEAARQRRAVLRARHAIPSLVRLPCHDLQVVSVRTASADTT